MADSKGFYWSHCIILAFRNGEAIRLSELVEKNPEPLLPHIEKLSEATGVPYRALPLDRQWIRGGPLGFDTELRFRGEAEARKANQVGQFKQAGIAFVFIVIGTQILWKLIEIAERHGFSIY